MTKISGFDRVPVVGDWQALIANLNADPAMANGTGGSAAPSFRAAVPVAAQMAKPLQTATPPTSQAPRDLTPDQLKDVADKTRRPVVIDEGVALAKALVPLSDADRARLVGLVVKRGAGGFQALSAESLTQARDQGLITPAEYSSVAKGFIDAANSATLAPSMPGLNVFLNTNRAGSMRSTVDANVSFINSAAGPQAQQFLRNYGREYLKPLNFTDVPAADETLRMLSGTTNKATIAEIYASFDQPQRQIILSTAVPGAQHWDGKDKWSIDGLAVLIDAVGTQKGAAPRGQSYDVLAIEIAKFAETSADDAFYDGVKPRSSRAQALGVLFANHSEAILDEFTAQQGAPGDGGTVENTVDNIQLSNLLRLTARNPENSMQAASQVVFDAYFDRLSDIAHGPNVPEEQAGAARIRIAELIRAEVLVPAQIFADSVELKQESAGIAKLCVLGFAKALDYVAGKLPPGFDKAAKFAIKQAVKVAVSEIEEHPSKGVSKFLLTMRRELDSLEKANPELSNLEDIATAKNEISYVAQRLADGDYKQILHSQAVPGRDRDGASTAASGAVSNKSATAVAPTTAASTTPASTVARRAPSHLKIVDVSEARSSGLAFNPDFRAMPTPQPGSELSAATVEIHAGEELARDLGLGGTAKDQPTGRVLPKPLDPKEPVFVRDPIIFRNGRSGGEFRMPDWVVYQKGQPVLVVEATKDADFKLKEDGASEYGSHKGSQLPDTILGLVNTFGSDRPIQYVIRSPQEPGSNAKDVLASIDAMLKKDAKFANVTVTWVAG
jgi:hypothetical protein